MTDTVIKGTGNSRWIKTVANGAALWPTWKAFLSDFCADGVPIDLSGLNDPGVQTSGTPYNKANVLPDMTCSMLGISTDSVLKDALNRLASNIDSVEMSIKKINLTINKKGYCAAGQYTGTGEASQTIALSFRPKGVLVMGYGYNVGTINLSGSTRVIGGMAIDGYPLGVGDGYALEVTGNNFTVYANSNSRLNQADQSYTYIAVG